MTTDTKTIIIAVITTGIAVIGITKTDLSGLRAETKADIRELRGLLITHISGHAH